MEEIEETGEIEEVEEEEEEEVAVAETTAEPAHRRDTVMMTGTDEVLPTVAGMTMTTLPAVEVVMMDGVVDLLAGEEEEVVTMKVVEEDVGEEEVTTMMTTVATMTTAGVATAAERTRKINFPTIWNI